MGDIHFNGGQQKNTDRLAMRNRPHLALREAAALLWHVLTATGFDDRAIQQHAAFLNPTDRPLLFLSDVELSHTREPVAMVYAQPNLEDGKADLDDRPRKNRNEQH